MLNLDYGINAKTVLECGSIKTITTYHKPDLIALLLFLFSSPGDHAKWNY